MADTITPKIEKTNRREVVAFRVYYEDGEIYEGNHSHEWLRLPEGRIISAVEFFYDDWKDGVPRREYLTDQESYVYPDLGFGTKMGGKSPKRLKTKLENSIEKPRSINPTKEGDFHQMPIQTMKGS